MKKHAFSRAASRRPVWTYETLMKWSDLEYHRNAGGEWELNQGLFSFNPLRDYRREIEQILLTGKIGNHDTLCNLRADFAKLEEDFNKGNLAGLRGRKRRKGGKQ